MHEAPQKTPTESPLFDLDETCAYLKVGRTSIHKLVKKQSAQTFWSATVASKKCTLHYLWQVDQRKNRSVQVGEITHQNLGLSLGEYFRDVDGHER